MKRGGTGLCSPRHSSEPSLDKLGLSMCAFADRTGADGNCVCVGPPVPGSQLPHLQLLEHTGVCSCAQCQSAGWHEYIPMHTCVLQLKQMKELDQEQEVLLQGLEMMARGREWYQQQLQRVQDRQHRLSQSRAAAAVSAGPAPAAGPRLP